MERIDSIGGAFLKDRCPDRLADRDPGLPGFPVADRATAAMVANRPHNLPAGVRALPVALLLGGLAASPAPVVGPAPLSAQAAHTEHTLRLDTGAPSPPARIADLAFLQGRWVGQGLGGEVDELWSKPAAGTMAGAFRLIREGQVSFYELFALEEEDGSVVLRVKHFNPGPGLPGWEERDRDVTFRLVKVEPRAAWFHGLTYRLEDPDTLVIYLALGSGEGSVREEAFRLGRVPG